MPPPTLPNERELPLRVYASDEGAHELTLIRCLRCGFTSDALPLNPGPQFDEALSHDCNQHDDGEE